jgi:hypothetical protein
MGKTKHKDKWTDYRGAVKCPRCSNWVKERMSMYCKKCMRIEKEQYAEDNASRV